MYFCWLFLPPAKEVWGKLMFLHMSVILFTGGVSVWCYFLSGCLIHVPSRGGSLSLVTCSFQGVSVQGEFMSRGGLCPGRVEGGLSGGGGSLSREEVSVQVGSLPVWVSVQSVACAQGGLCRERAPESEKQAVDMLLACFLVRHETVLIYQCK